MNMAEPTLRSDLLRIYLNETRKILESIDTGAIEQLAGELSKLRDRQGRLFVLGVGGSAAHASHAVNDFRKICGIEAYAPTDNVAELTARINDEGWESSYSEWLKGSRLREGDAVLVFSVGGGSREKKISANLVHALETARAANARILGIVSRDGGYTRQVADACVLIPVISEERVTPHAEGVCAVIWHLLVTLLSRLAGK